MVDANIKKIKILNKDLPAVNASNQHVLKYRILSDDRNRSSEFSSVYVVDSYAIPSLSTSITELAIASGTVTVTTAAAHGLSIGQSVTFSNTVAPFTAVTGTQTILTVPTTNTFTVLIGSSTVATAATTGTVASITVNKVGVTTAPAGFFSVSWTDTKLRPKYDIFVKFDNAASYSYHGTATGNVYTFSNTGSTDLRVIIQPEGIQKQRVSGLTLFESAVIAIP